LPSTNNIAVFRKASWILAIMLLLFFASGHTSEELPDFQLIGLDKFAHFCYFGLLATHVARTAQSFSKKRLIAFSAAVLLTFIYGASDEYHQSFIPGRSVGWDDIIADTSGALFAAFLYVYWPRYQAIMETKVISFTRQAGKQIKH